MNLSNLVTWKTIKDRSNFKSGLLYLFCFLVTLITFWPYAKFGVDPHHDGVMLKPALDVWSGQILYRDTFSQYGALTTYLQALAMSVGGPKLLTLKQITVITYALSAGLLALSWSKLLPISLTVISFFFWLLFAPFFNPDWILIPWSSVFALFFQSLTLFLWMQNRPSLLHAFMVGCMAGCTFHCRMPVGIALGLAISLSYLIKSFTSKRSHSETRPLSDFKQFFSSIAGFFFTTGSFLAALRSVGALGSWYYQTYVWPSSWAQLSNSSFLKLLVRLYHGLLLNGYEHGCVILILFFLFLLPLQEKLSVLLHINKKKVTLFYSITFPFLLFWEILSSQPIFGSTSGFAFAIPFLILLNFVLVFFPRLVVWVSLKQAAKKPVTHEDILLLGASIISLASWLQYYPVFCVRHLFWAISPMIGIFVFIWYQMSQKNLKIAILLMILFMTPLLKNKLEQDQRYKDYLYVEVTDVPSLEGMKTHPVLAQALGQLARAIKPYSGRPILLTGADALYATIVSLNFSSSSGQNQQDHSLQNPGPFYIDWGVDPFFEENRAQFIARYRPMILHSDNAFTSHRRDQFYADQINQYQYKLNLSIPELRSSLYLAN